MTERGSRVGNDSRTRLARVDAAVQAIQALLFEYGNDPAPPWLCRLSIKVFPALEAERDRLEKLFGKGER